MTSKSSSMSKTATIVANSFMSNISSFWGNASDSTRVSNSNSNAIIPSGSNIECVMPYYHTPTSIHHIHTLDHYSDGTIITRQEQNQIDKYENDADSSEDSNDLFKNLSIWLISTLKRRKKKMNKHKLRKRRKLLRLKSKK
jgi:hypothetical protein